MHIQRQSETFAYRVATAPTLDRVDEARARREIHEHLSRLRPDEAVRLWNDYQIPLNRIHRAPELYHYMQRVGPPVTNWAENEYRNFDEEEFRNTHLPQLRRESLGLPYRNWGGEDDEDDQSCPDCDFTTFFDRDMERHRFNYHGQFPEPDPLPGRSLSPREPVENTTDPNAKLKSPWYKKVQHYPSGQLPDEFDQRNLYRDFNFGTPGIATDSPRSWYRNDPDQGIYQINDSRRPLHNPPVGYVHYYADHPNKTVKIQYLDVHPKKRGQGVATALVSALAEDFPDYKINPGTTTSHGTGFVDYMRRNAPNAQERLDTSRWSPAPANQLTDDQLQEWGVQKRRSPVFARIALHNRQVERRRIAALTQDVVDRLKGEFDEWWKSTGEEWVDQPHAWPGRGPIGHWLTIERFLKENYPAAFKGFNLGHEEVTPMLDKTIYSDDLFGGLQPEDDCPACFGFGNSGHPSENCSVCGGDGWANPDALYDSGSKAVARHGYDPSEIAAGMLLLHNQSHPFRGNLSDADQERLVDIFQKRQKMQRDYEERQKGLVTAVNKTTQGVLNAQN